MRRAVVNREPEAVVRVSDLFTVLPASLGRVEFETFDEGEEPEVLERSLRRALLEIWQYYMAGEDLTDLVVRFDQGLTIEASDSMGSTEFLGQAKGIERLLERVVHRLGMKDPSEAELAGVLELCLEGLHLSKRVNKTSVGPAGRTIYGSGSP
jgi:magnesium chelatase subunit I